MSFTLKSDDVDRFVASILDAYKAGEMERDRAIGVLGHILFAAALGDQKQVEGFMAAPIEEHTQD